MHFLSLGRVEEFAETIRSSVFKSACLQKQSGSEAIECFRGTSLVFFVVVKITE